MSPRASKALMNFTTLAQVDVPQGRNGKHKEIVTQILSDLDQVPAGTAIKVPLADLAQTKEKVRSALNRAIHKGRRDVATASDANFLYVWNKAFNAEKNPDRMLALVTELNDVLQNQHEQKLPAEMRLDENSVSHFQTK